MEQIIRASEQMDGQMVSTLQDISTGKQTERDTLNLEIAHVADSMQPQIDIPQTELLGKMIVAKSNVTSFSEETQQLLKIEHRKFKGETSCLNQ